MTILDQSVADNRGRFDFTLPDDLFPENPKIEDKDLPVAVAFIVITIEGETLTRPF
ncbi:MAG: hypothetical protein OXU19_16055 [bacterium]|nr:hypothetical protein [bacterium]MDE0239744.1 hypothetical protein [bacterium]MDE0419248.1 hypothetical protein [bacterium]